MEKMIQHGHLVFKCRRCGGLDKSYWVSDGLAAITFYLTDKPLPKVWIEGCIDIKMTIHHCDDGNVGIADLAGFERDKDV